MAAAAAAAGFWQILKNLTHCGLAKNGRRDRREFVGQLNYGVLYKLWNPERHNLFGTNFHKAAEGVLSLQRRSESPMSLLPDECVYYILNMCRWDWFDDDGRDLKRRARLRKQRGSSCCKHDCR